MALTQEQTKMLERFATKVGLFEIAQDRAKRLAVGIKPETSREDLIANGYIQGFLDSLTASTTGKFISGGTLENPEVLADGE